MLDAGYWMLEISIRDHVILLLNFITMALLPKDLSARPKVFG